MLKDIQEPQRRKIFCYLNGLHHFDLFYNILYNNPSMDFYLHSQCISEDEYRKSKIYGLDNSFFVSNIDIFKYKLNIFGVFITTDAQSASAHGYSLALIDVFKQLSIPVIELQHGLFQLGLHYFDCPQKELVHGDSFATKSWADHILTYYRIDNYDNISVIGYPPYTQDIKSYDGEYGLILSNMHWGTYSAEERYIFYKSILQFVENSNKTFIWKMHHGEVRNSLCQKMLSDLFVIFPEALNKIIFFHQNNMLQKNSITDLIKKSDFVISTVSTVLLDCEMCHKKTMVFGCKTNECLTKKLKQAYIFKNYEDLRRCDIKNVKFETGLLKKYDNKVFVDCVNRFYSPNTSYDQDSLNIMLNYNKE